MPRVSVVIPAYRNVLFLHATLASVLTQDYRDYEVVIADHSSSDGTAEVIDEFSGDPRLHVLTPTPAGGGARRNWQRVTDAAQGELLKLVCGDDLVDPELLARQVRAFDEHPDLTLCATRRRLVDATGARLIAARGVPPRLWGHHSGAAAVRSAVRAGTNIFGEPCCVMMRIDSLAAIGGWDDTNPYVIDERTYCRALLADAGRGGFFGIGEALASFRISSTQWSVRLAGSQSQQVRQFHAELLREHPDAINPCDVRVGDLRARGTAHARRAVYLGLGVWTALHRDRRRRRSRPAPTDTSSLR